MSLEQKIKEVLEMPLTDIDYDVNQCVQICDEFAVGFVGWKDKNYRFYHKDNVYTKIHALSMNPEVFTLTELLEIYKQGL